MQVYEAYNSEQVVQFDISQETEANDFAAANGMQVRLVTQTNDFPTSTPYINSDKWKIVMDTLFKLPFFQKVCSGNSIAVSLLFNIFTNGWLDNSSETTLQNQMSTVVATMEVPFDSAEIAQINAIFADNDFSVSI